MKKVFKEKNKQPMVLRLLFLLFFTFFVLTSCQTPFPSDSSSSSPREEYISVILVDGEHFTILDNDSTIVEGQKKEPNTAYILKNSDVSFFLSADENYYPDTCSYEQHEFTQNDENTYTVHLKNVKYSVRFSVSFKYVAPIEPPEEDKVITYDPNGGTMYPNKENVQYYSTEHHPRPNTSIGTDIMYRDGYNLIGWNTQADLTGQHIGLGSRYLDINHQAFTLYAEWSKYSDTDNFEHILYDDNSIIITKYLGNEETISIPEYIDNKPVVILESESFVDSTAKAIILPKSIKTVSQRAFVNCVFEEIYLYDNIVKIYDECFVDCPNLSTVHVNAIEGARYVTADRHSTYADKVDRLILNKDKKKLIIFGGSGAYYNVDACLLKQHYPDHEVFNLALNGWFNGVMQMETIISYMGKGDYLLHVVEMCGKFQFMTDISMCDSNKSGELDYRFFCCLELNFDIISLADIRHVNNFFNGFTAFNDGRDKKPSVPYTEYTDFADERGDYMPNENRTKTIPPDGSKIITNEGAIDPESLSEEGANRLTNYYQQLAKKGARVFFAYCPVNKDSLSAQDLDESNIMEFGIRMLNWLSSHCQIINSIESVLFDFEWFADSDWHLDYEHALIFTEQIYSYIGRLK